MSSRKLRPYSLNDVKQFRLQILTPDDTFVEREVTSAAFQGESGRLTVLANHQDMVCSLSKGRTILTTANGNEQWETGNGVLKVFNNTVTVLVRHAAKAGG